jgi:hypothetical protein
MVTPARAGGVYFPARKHIVTIVTAAVRASIEPDRNDVEQRTYLKMILDCFWPFHYPYAAYNWELFPRVELSLPRWSFQQLLTQSFALCFTPGDLEPHKDEQ